MIMSFSSSDESDDEVQRVTVVHLPWEPKAPSPHRELFDFFDGLDQVSKDRKAREEKRNRKNREMWINFGITAGVVLTLLLAFVIYRLWKKKQTVPDQVISPFHPQMVSEPPQAVVYAS